MFFGKEATMKISLYANKFMSDDVPHVGAMVMVNRSASDILGCFSSMTYATPHNCFSCAMQLVMMAGSLRNMLEAMGHQVEVEDVLKSIEALNIQLRNEVEA